MCICICICKCVCICICICIRICVCICICICICMCIYIYIHIYAYIYIYIYIHIHIHMHIFIYIMTYTHLFICKCSRKGLRLFLPGRVRGVTVGLHCLENWVALPVWRDLSNRASFVLCAFRRVEDRPNLLHDSSLLKKTCVRRVVVDKWFPLREASLIESSNPVEVQEENLLVGEQVTRRKSRGGAERLQQNIFLTSRAQKVRSGAEQLRQMIRDRSSPRAENFGAPGS